MLLQNKYNVHLLMLFGVIAILSVVTVSSYTIAVGDMAYQKLYWGRMAIVFVICSLISLCLDKRGGNTFYLSVVWSLILLGGVEAVWGLWQIYGLAVSNHSLYALTGSFYNPGPYSGYLAMVFPICLSEWLNLRKVEKHTWVERGKYYMALGVLLLILCVLPAGMSRSAWIAVAVSGIWVYGIHCSWGTRLRKIGKRYKKRVFLAMITAGIVLIIISYALFQLKVGSANGRLLIWKVSAMTVAEKPFLGHGIGNFASAYGMAQENYFARTEFTATEEQVAGSPEYAFNEYLQIAVEYGVLFLLVVLLIISFCLWKGITEKKISACAGLISVLVFAFSSYPMQIPGFAIAFYFLLAACVVGKSRIHIYLFTVMIALLGSYYWKYNQYNACEEWLRCKMYYNMGAFRLAKEGYEKIYPELNDRGDFLFEYGHSLHKLKEYDHSTEVLKEAMMHSCDPMILNIIGKNYQATGEYEKAEEYFIRSTHRLPGRIYPYYLLAKLYVEPEYRHLEKLKQAVQIVLTKEPKVQSTAIKEMREEVKKLIKK